MKLNLVNRADRGRIEAPAGTRLAWKRQYGAAALPHRAGLHGFLDGRDNPTAVGLIRSVIGAQSFRSWHHARMMYLPGKTQPISVGPSPIG